MDTNVEQYSDAWLKAMVNDHKNPIYDLLEGESDSE